MPTIIIIIIKANQNVLLWTKKNSLDAFIYLALQ